MPQLQRWIRRLKVAGKQGKHRETVNLKVIDGTESEGISDYSVQPTPKQTHSYPQQNTGDLENSIRNMLGLGTLASQPSRKSPLASYGLLPPSTQHDMALQPSQSTFASNASTPQQSTLFATSKKNNNASNSANQGLLDLPVQGPTVTNSVPLPPIKDTKKSKKQPKYAQNDNSSQTSPLIPPQKLGGPTEKQKGKSERDVSLNGRVVNQIMSKKTVESLSKQQQDALMSQFSVNTPVTEQASRKVTYSQTNAQSADLINSLVNGAQKRDAKKACTRDMQPEAPVKIQISIDGSRDNELLDLLVKGRPGRTPTSNENDKGGLLDLLVKGHHAHSEAKSGLLDLLVKGPSNPTPSSNDKVGLLNLLVKGPQQATSSSPVTNQATDRNEEHQENSLLNILLSGKKTYTYSQQTIAAAHISSTMAAKGSIDVRGSFTSTESEPLKSKSSITSNESDHVPHKPKSKSSSERSVSPYSGSTSEQFDSSAEGEVPQVAENDLLQLLLAQGGNEEEPVSRVIPPQSEDLEMVNSYVNLTQ
jgi:hypothetical protein